jgi:hypothetical protein
MFAQELFVNLPADKAYRALLHYFQDTLLPKFRGIRSAEPSYIEAEFGSFLANPWAGISPLGTAKIAITPQGDRSQILIDYGFGKYLAVCFVMYLAAGLLLYLYSKYALEVAFILASYTGTMYIGINWAMNQFKSGISGYLKAVEQAHSPVS